MQTINELIAAYEPDEGYDGEALRALAARLTEGQVDRLFWATIYVHEAFYKQRNYLSVIPLKDRNRGERKKPEDA